MRGILKLCPAENAGDFQKLIAGWMGAGGVQAKQQVNLI